MRRFTRLIGGGLAGLALACGAAAASADPHAHHHHDHGAPAAAQGVLLPRFSATSELLELVGVLEGRTLTVYLDRFDDNTPVHGAAIALEVGGTPVALSPAAEGTYTGHLAQALQPGLWAVVATVTAGDVTDLLAGELDLHVETDGHRAEGLPWPAVAGGTLAALAGAAALALWATRHRRAAHPGGGPQ